MSNILGLFPPQKKAPPSNRDSYRAGNSETSPILLFPAHNKPYQTRPLTLRRCDCCKNPPEGMPTPPGHPLCMVISPEMIRPRASEKRCWFKQVSEARASTRNIYSSLQLHLFAENIPPRLPCSIHPHVMRLAPSQGEVHPDLEILPVLLFPPCLPSRINSFSLN